MRAQASLLAASAVTAVVLGTAAAVTHSDSQPEPASQPQSAPPTTSASSTPSAEPAVSKSSHRYKSVMIEGRGPVAPLSDGMREDLGTLAEQEGEPLDEILQRFYGVQEFETLANDLEADPDSGYVDAAWRKNTTAAPWIRFTRKPGAALLNRIEAEAPVSLEVQWGAPLTTQALVRLSNTIFGAVSDYPGVATAVGGPQSDGSIQVLYRVKSGATVDPARLKRQALKAGAKVSPTGDVPVKVHLVEDPKLRAVLD